MFHASPARKLFPNQYREDIALALGTPKIV